MNRRGQLLAGLCVVLGLSGAACAVPPGAPAANTNAAPAAVTVAQWQSDMLASLNANRANAGVGPLTICGTLQAAANGHSQDQANMNRMTHDGSNGSNIGQRADGAGYTGWRTLGENVAYGFTSVDTVMTAWMNSPGHRANILNPAFHDVGLANVATAGGTQYWTQDFGASGRC